MSLTFRNTGRVPLYYIVLAIMPEGSQYYLVKILNTTFLHWSKDNEGNKILIDVEINETKFRLINIYGPKGGFPIHCTASLRLKYAQTRQTSCACACDFSILSHPHIGSRGKVSDTFSSAIGSTIGLLKFQN